MVIRNCPKCGHVLDNLRVCPECGYTVRGPKPGPRASTRKPDLREEVETLVEQENTKIETTRKVVLDETEYTIMVIPPSLSPINVRIGKMLSCEATGPDEAIKQADEMDRYLNVLFEKCVSKPVKTEHRSIIYSYLQELTAHTLNSARLFREPQRPDSSTSRSVSLDGAQET